MKQFLTNIKREAEHIRMSSAEKAAMRAALFGAPAAAPQPSPYAFASYFSYNVRMSLAGLLFFVLAGASGVSAAAQHALPGDTLYGVKVLINERAELALAPNNEAKALLQEELAGRRVEEAQTLAAQGRLDQQTADTLTQSFDAHASAALALAEPEDAADAAQSAPVVATMSAEISPMAAPAAEPEHPQAKMAPMRTMMAAKLAPAEATSSPVATTTPFVAKHRGEGESLRAALRIKGDLLKSLRERAQERGDDAASSTRQEH